MTEIELFTYVMFAIGAAYVMGLGFAAYLCIRLGIPVFGMPAPPPPDIEHYRLPRRPVPPIA